MRSGWPRSICNSRYNGFTRTGSAMPILNQARAFRRPPSGFSNETSSTTRCVSNTNGIVAEATACGSRDGKAWTDAALSIWIGSPSAQAPSKTAEATAHFPAPGRRIRRSDGRASSDGVLHARDIGIVRQIFQEIPGLAAKMPTDGRERRKAHAVDLAGFEVGEIGLGDADGLRQRLRADAAFGEHDIEAHDDRHQTKP